MSNMSLPAYFVGADVALKTTILLSLVTPLPFGARKSYMRFLMTNKLVSKLVYFLKIVSIFVALLFIDALRTAYTVVITPEKEGFNSGLDGGDPNAMVATNLESRKLLAERNMALTGTSLFLSFICLRVFELSVENVRWGEQVHAQKGEDTGPPIDDHRADFKRNYDAQKPDHKAATKRRGMDKQNTSMAATS